MKKILVTMLICVLCVSVLAGCGEEKVPPHDHEWTEATYEAASSCTVCGEVQGEPLVPDFVKYGITTPLEVGGTYEYTGASYDFSTPIKGTTTVKSYELADSAGLLTPIDGYVCHKVRFETTFDAYTVQNYGIQINRSYVNYYNIAYLDENAENEEESTVGHSKVLINGEPVDVHVDLYNEFVDNSDGSVTNIMELYVQAPIGYDGMVCGLANPNAQIPEDGTLADVFTEADYLLFRLDGKVE